MLRCAGQGEVKTLVHEPIISESMVKLRAAASRTQPRAPIQPPQGLCPAGKGFPFNAVEKAEQQLYFSPVAMKCLQK